MSFIRNASIGFEAFDRVAVTLLNRQMDGCDLGLSGAGCLWRDDCEPQGRIDTMLSL